MKFKGPCHWSNTNWAWWKFRGGCSCRKAIPPKFEKLTLFVFSILWKFR